MKLPPPAMNVAVIALLVALGATACRGQSEQDRVMFNLCIQERVDNGQNVNDADAACREEFSQLQEERWEMEAP